MSESLRVALVIGIQVITGGYAWIIWSKDESVDVPILVGMGLALGSFFSLMSQQLLRTTSINNFAWFLPTIILFAHAVFFNNRKPINDSHSSMRSTDDTFNYHALGLIAWVSTFALASRLPYLYPVLLSTAPLVCCDTFCKSSRLRTNFSPASSLLVLLRLLAANAYSNKLSVSRPRNNTSRSLAETTFGVVHQFAATAQRPVPTLADGIAVKKPGIITRPLVDKWVDEIVAVDESSVADAMMLLMEHSRLFVEGGGAVGVSALLTGRVTPAQTGTTCVVLSGGNVDLGLIPNLIRRHETEAGRRLIVFTRLPDRPGGLARLLTIFANMEANLIEVQHVREGLDFAVRETGVQITVEIRGAEHAELILNAAKAEGYEISAITGR